MSICFQCSPKRRVVPPKPGCHRQGETGADAPALLVQLYQPELITTGPAAKVRSGKGFAAADDRAGGVSPQGPVWIGKDFRLDRTPRAAASNSSVGGSSGIARRPHWRRGHWHTVLHGEKRQSRRMQWFQPVYVGLSNAD